MKITLGPDTPFYLRVLAALARTARPAVPTRGRALPHGGTPMLMDQVYDSLMKAGLGKTYGPRRIREIAGMVAADTQDHSYPKTEAWIQEHGDQLRFEGERRGMPDLDTLLSFMLDDVLAIYVDADQEEVDSDRDLFIADPVKPRTAEQPISPDVQAFTERTRQGWGLPAQPLVPPNRGPWARY